MENEWLEISYINFDKAIMHGRVCDGTDEFRVMKEREIEQELTDAQKQMVEDLNFKHGQERKALLRSFISDNSEA